MYTTRAPQDQGPVSSVAARLARFNAPARPPEPANETDGAEMRGDVLVAEPAPAFSPPSLPVLDSWRVISWLWSGRLLIVLCLVAGVVAALGVSRVLPPRFTSYAELLIAPPSAPIAPDSYAAQTPRDTQMLEFDSRLRMLTSTNVLERTVVALGLDTDPEFVGLPKLSLPFLGASPEEQAEDARLGAMRSLYERVGARRDGQTYVATLEVSSQDAHKSVRIANGLIAAFQEELWEAERTTAGQAVEALNERLGVLRESVSEAEAAVEDFRRANGLHGGEGQLLASRSLDQVNTQVNDARATLIAAESRHAELVGARNATTGESGIWDNEAIAGLRAQYNELRRQLDAQSAIYGPRHPNITALRPQMQTLEAAINQEADRIIRAAAADMEQARSVVDQLSARADLTRVILSADESALITLRELQREVDAQTTIYENYLRRSGELNEQSQIESTAVRVISPPLPAAGRSWPPRTIVLLVLGAFAGLAVGGGIAILAGATRAFLPVLRGKLAEVSGR